MTAHSSKDVKEITDRDLVISRLIDAPREKIYRAWTEPELMKQWFAPKPWGVSLVDMDVRPGGSSLIVMKGPDGQEFPNPGLFLEVVPNEKLVFTDAFTSSWELSPKPFMTVVLTLEDVGGKTQYTAIARHWTLEDKEAHEKMGFHEGWGKCVDQLEELVATL